MAHKVVANKTIHLSCGNCGGECNQFLSESEEDASGANIGISETVGRKMINNKLDNNGNVIEEVRTAILRRKRGNGSNHVLECRPLFRGKWDLRKKIGQKQSRNIRRSAVIFADLSAEPSVVVIRV